VSDVTLTIGGRPYAVACDPGQEGHIQALGRSIDAKLSALPGISGQGEARTLLFAALLLADELHEARSGGAPQPAQPPLAVAENLEALASRLEGLAERLESGG